MSNAPNSDMSHVFDLRVLAGPAAVVAVRTVPLAALRPEGHFALATYAWTLAWWATVPVPWAVTGLLPFVSSRSAG